MCWNCGCMMPDDDHGNPDNITTETLRKAAKAGGMKSLMEDGKLKIFNGITTPSEVVRITQTEGAAVD